jgi:hypothetical protein
LFKGHARIVLLTLGLIIVVFTWLFWPDNRARRNAERTRLLLREEGFKTDLSEFAGPIPDSLRARLDLFSRAGSALAEAVPSRNFDLMTPVATNAALVLALHSGLPGEADQLEWQGLRRVLDAKRELLDEACSVAISQEPQAGQSPPNSRAEDPGFQEMQNQRSLAMALAMRTVLDLREHDENAAWTNALALTRFAAAPQCQLGNFPTVMRFGWVTIAERATWEALQVSSWDDRQLAELQAEWQTPNFFAGLTDTIAFGRAINVAACEAQRQVPPPPRASTFQIAGDLLLATSRGWDELTSGWRYSRYRGHGSYADERAILVYFRDRELEVSRATNASCWLEMRSLPGVTNAPALSTDRQFPTQMGFGGRQSGPSGGARFRQSLLGRAAEAETRRRLVVTALALERYRRTHERYPDALDQLVPSLLPEAPIDFMDGKPLRYRLTGDHHFFLYSTGLDCVDDGGQMRPDTTQTGGPGRGLFRSEGPDLLWPRPASLSEVETEKSRRQFARSGLQADNSRN